MNHKLLLLLLTTLLFCQTAFSQKHGKIDVYLIGGQSNATGQGYIANMADTMKTDTTILLFHSGRPHLNSGKAAYTWMPLRQASESPDRFGMELSFGSKIRLYDHNKQIAIIKHAHSGTNLFRQWNPGKDKNDTAHWGPQFKTFVQTVDSGLNELRKMGYKPVIKGMLWHQGESDAINTDSASYKYAVHLSHFIARVREQFNTTNMPFVYGYIRPQTDKSADMIARIIQAQHDVASDSKTPLSVKGIKVFKTDDLSQRANDNKTPYPNDHVHFGTDGTWMLGVRMAQQFKN
jgi:hypothetical protein